ncbi:recombinase family protein [Candidatus Margulisiibacteriota bacterium]
MKAVILTKKSSDAQKQEKIKKSDLTRCKRYCRDRNFEIIKTYQLDGTEYFENTCFENILKLQKKSNEKIVLVTTKISNLTRKLQDLIKIFDKFFQNNIEFIFIDNCFESITAYGKAAFRLFKALAEYEKDNYSERIKNSISERKKKNENNKTKIFTR